MAVMEAALRLRRELTPTNVIFLIDSQAAILGLSNNNDTDCQITITCRHQLSSMTEEGWALRLQWIPSHVSTLGNEKANYLAKLGTNLPQPAAQASLKSAEAHIDNTINLWTKNQHLAAAAGKSWEGIVKKPIPLHLPRQTSVALFRTMTGHDYLASHLHRIGVLSSSQCLFCDHNSMDAGYLLSCPERMEVKMTSPTPVIVSIYWAARRRMAEMSRVGVG
jgi:hypothetical protein